MGKIVNSEQLTKNREWKEVKLQDVVTKLGDGLHGTPKYSDDGEYYFINGNNLFEGKIIFTDKTKRVDFEEYSKYKKELSNRTIMVSINGTLGNIAFYNGEKVILGKSACYFNVKECVDKNYIRYTLSGNNFKNYIENYSSGTTIKNLSLKAMREYPVNLPPIHEQQKIASILKSLDDKIELNNQMNQTLEEMAQSIFKEWFVEFNFPNEEGVPYKDNGGEMVKSELGEIPKGWRVGSIDEIIEINPRVTLKKGDTAKYVDMKALSENQSIISGVIEREFKGSGTKFSNEDTLMARITPCLENGKTGFVNFLQEDEAAWGSTEFNVLRSKNRIAKAFTYFLARDKNFRDYAIANMNGSSGRQRISGKILELYEIPIPSEDILDKFGDIATSFMKQIQKNGEEIETLIKTRDALLPKLMSGEVRV
ncbi:restriction endonuclease subunit S [uncultured Ilyobacter sp.]|uniref:restriction endonuclease subunit S n=1 Tax=uncultured Ilyobacter sp. TaxID=544433 RepID=UPI0029F5A1CD|nr:restriction endonuclease subunit S [uncultured Ilyobacter sp.]